MTNKRSELANILRRLADYVDRHPDHELAPIFEQAAALFRRPAPPKKNGIKGASNLSREDVARIATELRQLSSRPDGESFLIREVPFRRGLEALARFLQLPVQRDDSVERLRAKIVENTIGSRLRSNAIQG